MKNLLTRCYLLLLPFFLGSCSLLGIHLSVHNPKKPGKAPTFSEEEVLLGEMTPYRSCFDVHYYDLALSIEPETKSLSGSVEIHSTATTDFDTLQIDLHPNFTLTSLTDKNTGKPLAFRRRERAVFVATPRKQGENFTLVASYAGKPLEAKKAPWLGGFVWEKDKAKNPWVGVACESDGASLWWPLKDHTADEPDSMRLHYSVPKGLVAVGNGQLEGKQEGEQLTTYNWFISYPINTYNITVYVGKFKLLEDTYTGVSGKRLRMHHYVLPQNYQVAKEHFQQLHPILKTFEQRFGEYPWYEDGFKLVESPYAGMEHQTAIAYGNGYKNNHFNTDYIILHETAHEWWGNSITAKDLADVWLQEGFATYAEAVYFEDKQDRDKAEQHLMFHRMLIKNKYPVVGIKDRRWFHYKKNSDVYMKGAWILHSLRGQLENDALFFDILKTFAENYKRQIVETQDFVSWVNQKTGTDYSWFFAIYLNQNQVPELEYTITSYGVLHYRWKHVPAGAEKLKLKLVLHNEEELTLTPSLQEQRLNLPRTPEGGWRFYFKPDFLYALEENKKMLKQ